MAGDPLNPMLQLAADRLVRGCAAGPTDADGMAVAEFLAGIGYLPDASDPPPDPAVVGHRARMLRAAARMHRLFMLPTPDAPNLTMMGAEVRASAVGDRYRTVPTAGVSGSGMTVGAAFEACVGEGVEYLSQFEQPGDVTGPVPGVEVVEPFPTATPVVAYGAGGGFVCGRRLGTGDAVLVPAARCLRRSAGGAGDPPFALGTGCGAGRSFAEAALHGLLELIERDAAAIWWRGGRVARPLAMDGDGVPDAVCLLSALRGPRHGRGSWFLDITTDLGVPTVAAVSVDADGRRVACGTSCRLSMGSALAAAVREMCQMELAYDVVDAKERESGEAGLNATDRRHKERASAIDAGSCAMLHPRGRPTRHVRICDEADPDGALAAVVRHLNAHGVQVIAIELTRAILGIPVVRVVAPELQLYPCEIVTRRLRDTIDATGRDEVLYPLV